MSVAKPQPAPSFGPLDPTSRNVDIDRIRGAAVLGLAYMMATAYGLNHAAFYWLDIDSSSAWDWVAGIFGHIAFDLKASALVLLVFGAGIAKLMDRAEAHGKNPKRFLLLRILVLFLIGVPPGVHAPLWEGNYHLFVAVFCIPTVLMFGRQPKTQLVTGVVLVLLSLALVPVFQSTFPTDGLGLGQYWWPVNHPFYHPDPEPYVHPTGYFMATLSLRLAGTILAGSALYRCGVIQGNRDRLFYRNLALFGFGLGLPLAGSSVAWLYIADYDPSIALTGHLPNQAAAVPIALGYLAVIVLWGKNNSNNMFSPVKFGLQAVGRMALTNSIIYVTAGMFVIREGFGRNYFSRAELALVVVIVWIAQLAWSAAWLSRFRFGPFEWLTRAFVYRRLP